MCLHTQRVSYLRDSGLGFGNSYRYKHTCIHIYMLRTISKPGQFGSWLLVRRSAVQIINLQNQLAMKWAQPDCQPRCQAFSSRLLCVYMYLWLCGCQLYMYMYMYVVHTHIRFCCCHRITPCLCTNRNSKFCDNTVSNPNAGAFLKLSCRA